MLYSFGNFVSKNGEIRRKISLHFLAFNGEIIGEIMEKSQRKYGKI